MKSIKFNIPVLVQNLEMNGSKSYHIKPLFIRHPVATNQRFEVAIRQFQKEVRHNFKGFELNTENSRYLLWYMFSPELAFKQFRFTKTINSQLVQGLVSYVIFEVKNNRYICLPHFDAYIFMLKKELNGKYDIASQLERVLSQLFKQLKKEFGRDLDLDPYFSNKKEFLSSIEVNVSILYDGFKFEKDPNDLLFMNLSGATDFVGEIEIEKVAHDLNALYPDELNHAYLMEDMVKRVFDIVYGQENVPLVIVGETGVGKHTLIHEVVFRFIRNFYGPKKQRGPKSRIWQLDPTRVIAGMSYVGWWQKRLESIIEFLQKPHVQFPQSDKILIDNIVALLRIGKSAQNNMTMADLLKPYIEKRQLQTILLATPEEWKIMQENDRRFSDLFQVIRLQQPDVETTTKIVLERRKKLEIANSCEISIQAIDQLLSIQRNYMKQDALPGSVLKLLEKMSVKYRLKNIDADEVRNEFRDYSGLNESIFDTGLRFEKDEVRTAIAKQLVGQEAAVKALADVVHLIKSNLSDPDKPNASFLFIGPTGVGKTQAAKVLAKHLLGNEDYLLRFDMNEYIDAYAVQRLIGDSYNPEGLLTGRVRYRPFGIILLDEIEKAHPNVHDILLQVLDDGRLTDSLGRTVDFTNTIIIMTSNLGASDINAQISINKSSQNDQAIYRKAIEQQFRPEFINRIDKITIFNPLQPDHILGIARLQIKELLQRDGFVRRTTILNISNEALEWVAQRGYNAQMGGRALKRQIEQDLTALSADQLLNMQTDRPIILEIKINKGQLVPNIQPLEFVSSLPEKWLPVLPEERKGKGFFKALIRRLEKIERQIRYLEERNNSNTGYIEITEASSKHYIFKEKIAEAKEKIKHLMLGFRDHHFTEGPAIPLRFKASALKPRSYNSRGVRENIKDQLFQKEALEELANSYQFGSNKFDSLQTEFIDCFLDIELIELYANDFLNQQTTSIVIRITSCINGTGQDEVQFLLEHYERLFKQLELDYTLDKAGQTFTANGYGLFDLLQGEAGIHLFYQSHQNPLPIKLSLETKNLQANKSIHHYQVIRIYDSQTNMMDLRTQFTNAVDIRFSESKLLLYAGFHV